MINYLILIAINLLYACVGVFTKYASQQDFLSIEYIFALAGAILVMGVYAVLWQQVLKKIELSLAYMFKGTSIIFVMLLAKWLFGENISLHNIFGALIIVIGIVLFAYTPKVEK